MSIRRKNVTQKLKSTWSAWLGVAALLLQTLAPLVPMPAMEVTSLAFGGPAALCLASADGAKALPGDHDHDKAPAAKIQPCAICLSLHLLGGFLPPSTETAFVPSSENSVIDRVAEIPALTRWTATGTQPRAPPILV